MIKKDLIVIGFGKAGKTFAAMNAKKGLDVLLIERDELMQGGTCINVACIPTKTLEHYSQSAKKLKTFEEKANFYRQAVVNKNTFISKLREKNRNKLLNAGAQIIIGEAAFVNKNTVKVNDELYTADKILINTGSKPRTLNIEGSSLPHVHISEDLLSIETLPKHLVIVGGGFIGLEFASYYLNFGSKVTLVTNTDDFMPTADKEIAKLIYDDFISRGLSIIKGDVSKFTDSGLVVNNKDIESDAILVSIGRSPNIESLHLENTDVSVNNGYINCDEQLKAGEYIYVAGDVKKDYAFTYMSLDDSRILSHENRTMLNRGFIPMSLFIDPPYAFIGENSGTLKKKYHEYKLPVSNIVKANMYKETKGLFKVYVDDNDYILGAHLYGYLAHELINLFTLAMNHKIPFQDIKNQIYTHPTFIEGFNDFSEE